MIYIVHQLFLTLTILFIFRYIESMNRKGLSYELAVNHFADHTFDEIRSSRREIRSTDYYNGQLSEENHSHKNLPVKEVLTMVKVRVLNFVLKFNKL